MNHLFQLPIQAFLNIFTYLTFNEILSLRFVCRHFATLVVIYFNSAQTLHVFYDETTFRRFITEVLQADSIELCTHRDLAASRLNSLILGTSDQEQFLRLFTGVKTLSLHLSPQLVHVIFSTLLTSKSSGLEALTLDMTFYSYLSACQRRHFWRQLASISTLRRLHLLNLNGQAIPAFWIRRLAAGRRLTDFTLTGCGNTHQTLVQFRKPLECLAIDWLPAAVIHSGQLSTLKRIAQTVRRLTILRTSIPVWVLDYLQLCRFLQHLDISMVVELTASSRLFLQLDGLCLFSLAISTHLVNNLVAQVKTSLAEREGYFRFYYQFTTPFTALTTVRILQLHLHNTHITTPLYQRPLFFTTLARQFPGLRRLEVFSSLEQSLQGQAAFIQNVVAVFGEQIVVIFKHFAVSF